MKRLLLLVALVVAGCTGGDETGSEEPSSKLTDVSNVAQLRSLFNEREGVPRLILLVAPT